MLEQSAREQGRSLPDVVRRAVDRYLDPNSVTVTLTPTLADELDAISRAAPHGRVSRTEMAQRALEEFAAGRVQAPEVQQVLKSIRGAALRLLPNAPPSEASTPGDAKPVLHKAAEGTRQAQAAKSQGEPSK